MRYNKYTPQEQVAFLQHYATEWSISEFEKLTGEPLIKVIREIGIPYYSKLTADEKRQAIIEKVLDYKGKMPVTLGDLQDVTDKDTKVNDIALKLSQDFMGLLAELKQSPKDNFPSVATNLIFLSKSFRSEIEDKLSLGLSESPSPATIRVWKNDVYNSFKSFCLKYVDSQDDDYKTLMNILEKTLNADFKDLGVEVRKTTNTNINKRRQETIQAKVSELLTWAKGRLNNLPEKPSLWSEVAIALMLVTGRRPAEIQSKTTTFTYVDDGTLLFEGQLKSHGEDKPAYEIPVLTNADDVIKAWVWLIDNEKVEDTPEKSHKRFARYVNETVKVALAKYVEIVGDNDWTFTKLNSKGESVNADRRNCRLLRQIYSQVLIIKNNIPKNLQDQYIVNVLGHADSESSLKVSAINYEADIEVIDEFN